MKINLKLTFIILVSVLFSCNSHDKMSGNIAARDNINVDEITKQHLKEWQSDKFGMFIHWGLYSIPAGIWNGKHINYYAEQIMNHARIPVADYEQLAKQFNPMGWNADSIVLLAKDAGMKYIVFTSKHHDGFCMFKTATTKYNVVDATPFGRDVVKELADACHRHSMKFGLYYSLPDWHFNGGIPRLEADTTTDCTQHVNQVYSPLETITDELEENVVSQLTELLTNYGEIETIWFDMGLLTPEQSKHLRKVVKSIQPSCLISGRIMNYQGDYLTLPDNGDVAGYEGIAWDNPASMYGTWGYKSWQERIDEKNQCKQQIIRLMQTVSHGGVFLLNIGPDGDGNVIDYEKNVLRDIGKWTSANSEAIYDSQPTVFDKLDNACCTRKGNKLYITISDISKPVVCKNIHSQIDSIYCLSDKNLAVNHIMDGNDLVINCKDTPCDLTTIVLAFKNEDIKIGHSYILPEEDGSIILTGDNAITHAAVDGRSYMTTQANSWKSWFVDVKKSGIYNAFAVYLPNVDEKVLSLNVGNQTITHTFPGVDRMVQTTYIGKIAVETGKQEVTLKQVNPASPLEALGIDLKRILLIEN